jgi:hypothetical protein
LTVFALALGTRAQRDDDGRVAGHRCCFQRRLGVEAESSIHVAQQLEAPGVVGRRRGSTGQGS